MNNFGVRELLNQFVKYAPAPLPRETTTREVHPEEKNFFRICFKIQANMDHSIVTALLFSEFVQANLKKNMKIQHVRLKRGYSINNALTFMASEREQTEEAYPGDIIGLHNYGTIQIGDTLRRAKY